MLKCKEITELSNRVVEGEKLSMGTRMKMWMHLMMCKYCGRYHKHNKQLQVLFDRIKGAVPKLSEADKTKIKEQLKE